MAVTTAKLVAVALLGAVAMVLASAAIALSLILRQKKSPNYGRIKVQRGGGGGPNSKRPGRGGTDHIRPPYQPPFDPTRDLPAHRRFAPDPTSARRAGDVHLSHAIRLATGNPFGDVLPHGDSGVDDYYSYEGNPDLEWMMRTGNAGASASGSFTSGAGRGGGGGGGLASFMGGGGNSVARVLLSPLVLLDNVIAKLVGGEGIGIGGGGLWRSLGSGGGRRRKKGSSGRGATKVGGAGGGFGGTNDTEAFWHLTRSAELGNPHAQYWLGNALASGVFAGRGRDGPAVAEDGAAPVVPDDLGAGGSDLGRALTLWHMAAMGGVMEAQMALGYRYNAALKASGGGGGGNAAAGGAGKRNRKDKAIGGADVSYGVPGDCMAAMAYYEEAANAAMDEMEASPLRGKVTPATDRHRLSEIHMHGASSALAHHNKPDELEEALEYLRIRATHAHDAHSAFTLANLHHYGLRGVSQDMRLALKYYEMAATANFDPDFPLHTSHPEAAGQVAKIYFLGMGVEPDPVEAYRFMRMGAPGGWKNCSVGGGEEEGEDGEELVECDAEALNCLGLAHLLGIDGLVDVNQKRAVRYFSLARDLGSYDAVYHLAMMRMGWMNNVVEDEDVDQEGFSKEEVVADAKKKKEQLDEMFEEVSNEVAAALEAAGEQGQDPATLARAAAAALGRVDRLEAMRESMDGIDEEVTIQLEQVIKKGDDASEAAGSEESDAARDAASSEGGDGGSSVAAKSAPKQELKIRHIQLKPPTESVDQKERYGKVDYTRALNEFVRAGSKGHIQSIHRAGVMYARGIGTGVNCPKAVQYLRQVAESSPGIGRRLRLAYRSYKSGKVDLSLRNYLAAAEAGIELAQSNAAWLLERGYCLGLDKRGCVNASLRMWRAASRQGNAEASLRVGDFHYYGRLNQNDVTESGWDWPFLISYLTHPSIWVRRARAYTIALVRKGLKITRKRSPRNQRKAPQGVEDDVVDITPSSPTSATSPSGDASKEPQTCPAGDDTCKAARSLSADGDSLSKQTLQERNFHMAAQYYRKAVEANSPRASFNLGFMYEWGLGLKQDFPLAKRYYDSAASNHREAALAVNIALTSMNFHEKVVKMRQNYKEKWGDKGVWEVATEKLQEAVFGEEIGALLSSNENSREILTSHLWSFETCLIVVLVIVLSLLVRHHIASRARVIELQVQR